MELAFQFVSVPFLCYGICYLLLKTNIKQGVKFRLLAFLLTWIGSGFITLVISWRLHSDAPLITMLTNALTNGDLIGESLAGSAIAVVIMMCIVFRPIIKHLSEQTPQQ
jgi:uncharacterized membrane protein